MPGAAGAQPLGQRALRSQLHLEIAGQVLPRELLVHAEVAADRPPDALLLQQQAQAGAVNAELFDTISSSSAPWFSERVMRIHGIPANPKPPTAILAAACDVGDRLGRRTHHLVHHATLSETAARPWPPPDAHCLEGVASAGPLELVGHRGQDPGSGRPDRVSERDARSGRVQPLVVRA